MQHNKDVVKAGRVTGAMAGLLLFSGLTILPAADSAAATTDPDIKLEISPRICLLTEKNKQCEIPVRAQWRSEHEESLCLVIVARPDVKHCWERFSAGNYTIELTFTDDTTFELRDVSLQHVFASEVLRVIREAIHYRHRRRQPWNIFE
jgi:hypothetical protein